MVVPPGPGVFATTRPPAWSALAYAQQVAGVRPDLTLLAPIDRKATGADVVVANAMRAGSIVGADAPAFGRLDMRFVYPRGRGYQLLLGPPPASTRVIPPAQYASAVGAQLSILLAVDRALYEATNGRLGAAARAAGLTDRFGAADLAILSTTAPSRPAFFGFIPPLDALPPGPWILDSPATISRGPPGSIRRSSTWRWEAPRPVATMWRGGSNPTIRRSRARPRSRSRDDRARRRAQKPPVALGKSDRRDPL
jgi:hypothetical protein